jgi:endonuclease YncB( thermonuclease family)
MTRRLIIAWLAFWAALGVGYALAAPALSVIDGDGIRLGKENIRVLGLDAPEIIGAKCPEEKAKAVAARDALLALLSAGAVTIEPRRSLDKYRRPLAVVRVNGFDVAPEMIRMGHARPYGGEKRLPWCSQ